MKLSDAYEAAAVVLFGMAAGLFLPAAGLALAGLLCAILAVLDR